VVVGVAVIGLAVLAWIVSRDDGGSGSSAGGSAKIMHVHGLGIDPTDGTLMVATHHGVYRLADDGSVAQLGPVQDTMGFTVVGAAHFLGSGHPGEDDGRPGLLGLIESTNGAASWKDVSLSGQVDFHALAYAHDQVYGWDATSGRFMVSTDRQEWLTRSTLQLFGFTVDPKNADHIVATTPDGVQASADGGRSWQPVAEAPALVLVAWDANSGLWGLGADGTAFHTDDPDAPWQQAGALEGQPQALLAAGDTLYAAASDEADITTLYRSTDAGRTWQVRYRDA
jgi:photosystem II stability/assembly factor-like uncharacterized protein